MFYVTLNKFDNIYTRNYERSKFNFNENYEFLDN